MGKSYYVPRSVKGETRILSIFTVKSFDEISFSVTSFTLVDNTSSDSTDKYWYLPELFPPNLIPALPFLLVNSGTTPLYISAPSNYIETTFSTTLTFILYGLTLLA